MIGLLCQDLVQNSTAYYACDARIIRLIYLFWSYPAIHTGIHPKHSGALLCVTVQLSSSVYRVVYWHRYSPRVGLHRVNGRPKARSGRARTRRARTPEPPLSSAFTFRLVALEPPLVPPPGLVETTATGPGSDFRKNHGTCLGSPESKP